MPESALGLSADSEIRGATAVKINFLMTGICQIQTLPQNRKAATTKPLVGSFRPTPAIHVRNANGENAAEQDIGVKALITSGNRL